MVAVVAAAVCAARPSLGDEAESKAKDVKEPARVRGVAPGDEKGPGGFVKRRPELNEETFYAASGGQLWYYLNLFTWVPEDLDPKGLWIREEVVETFSDLKKWPDGTDAKGPPAKTTVEYWKVGSPRRTVTIDNHKDFWLEAENWNAGKITVTMTLSLGCLSRHGADGSWAEPKEAYLLESRTYPRRRRARR